MLCVSRVATILWKKNKDFSRTFKYVFPTYFSDVLPCDDREYLMFLASYKISICNCSYTELTEDDGSVESLAFYKLLYTVQSIELEVSKMNLKCT